MNLVFYRNRLENDTISSISEIMKKMGRKFSEEAENRQRDILEQGKAEGIELSRKFSQKIDESINGPSQSLSKNWTIIAFSDKTYIPAAKIWYKQLASLGYKNHKIIALDEEAFEILLSENFRVERPIFYFKNEAKLGNLWSLRLKTLQKYISNNQNIFISDVDSIWVTYKDLSLLPENIDTFHGIGKTYPDHVYEKWGFVICGCIGAYRANERSREFFEKLVENCKWQCDDQLSVNEMLMKGYRYCSGILRNRYNMSYRNWK